MSTEEQLGGSMAEHLLAMTPCGETRRKEVLLKELFKEGGGGGNGNGKDDGKMMTATIDMIVSTHRVWLGTGGEPI